MPGPHHGRPQDAAAVAVAVADPPEDRVEETSARTRSGGGDDARLTLSSSGWLDDEATRVRLAGALVVALVAALVVSGILAWQRGTQEPSALAVRAHARDEARAAALRDIETLLTADHRDAAGTFTAWSAVTTGRLHAQLAQQRKSILKRLRATKEITTVRPVEAALSSWDEAAGTARLLAVLDLRKTSGDQPSTQTVRYLAMTQRVDGKWLLSAVQQVGGDS
ncbi:hypothetical protein [Nocardioides daeguensis]|uniref:Mce-associated membrane protein n=1 Tax=Nocardioides daeguensis TaxID=908359 RepID=A0ABP6UWJ7_9ACTN|nr:hypothetical protein [Nocardioides daeguensis]MBV6728771.1 hypothetical protein [Nocardioides daeguensis]MCR1773619.1 hypothetical protein [Nocardioides daeguensis]